MAWVVSSGWLILNCISESGHKFQNSDVLILDSETGWHERGIKEAIYDRIEKPSLTNKLRFKLSHAWDPVLFTMPRRLSASINPAFQHNEAGESYCTPRV